MLTKILAYGPSIIGILLVSTAILLRNHKSKINRLFFILNATVSLWLIILFAADTTAEPALATWLVRTAVAVSNIFALIFVIFSFNFPYEKSAKRLNLFILSLPSLALFFISFTSLMVPSVEITESGAQLTEVTVPYSIYSLTLVFYFLLGGYFLIRNRKKANLLQKQQINLVLLGVMTAFVINLLTGYILTVLDAQENSNLVGSFSLFIFAVITAYAIVKHKLFDIRPIVARSFAYLLLVGTLAIIFAGSLFAMTSLFFDDQTLTTGTKAVYVLIALLLAFLLQPLKRFFNKFTNRLFYRDAYDPQDMLNRLNTSLVTATGLDALIKKSSSIILHTLNAEFCTFAIREAQGQSVRLSSKANNIDHKIIMEIVQATSHIPKKIILADELQQSKHKLFDKLQSSRVSVFIKLRGTSEGHLQNPGYILLGQKKSGGLYSEQDIRVLEIIADELVIAIQNALRFEEIQQFNVTLQQKVEEATKQLRNANQRLKELDQTKDEFISMASHQLRTPLTTIKGYLSMVLEGDVGPVTKSEKKMIQQAFDSAERMVFLIADLLNVSRLQSGKFVIDNKPTDLAKMVKTEVEQLKDTAAHHNLTLTCKVPDKMPLLSLDETKIRQVVMNFLDNAIYYTPAGGSISVELELTSESVRYTVTDTGLGVPKAEQHHLFSKFYRAGNARKMRPDGTGLGLFMARKVVVAQGGSVIFKSTEGKGSTFGFSFPRHKLEIKGKHAEKQLAEPAA